MMSTMIMHSRIWEAEDAIISVVMLVRVVKFDEDRAAQNGASMVASLSSIEIVPLSRFGTTLEELEVIWIFSKCLS